MLQSLDFVNNVGTPPPMADPPPAEATAAVTLGTDLYIIDKMSEIIAYQHAIE